MYPIAARNLVLVGILFLLTDGLVCSQDFPDVPCVVIDHLPKSSGNYLGSPSIVILPDGKYIASHDIFGKGLTPVHTHVFESAENGGTGQPALGHTFCKQGYLVSSQHHQRVWTNFYPPVSRRGPHLEQRRGGLSTRGSIAGRVPVQVFKGRVWKGMERNVPVTSWGNFQSFIASAPVDANLLDPKSWTFTQRLKYDRDNWKPGNAWLEGNVAMNPKGEIWDIKPMNNNM